MRAVVGDRLHVHGRVVGTPDQTSEIIEIRGRDGAPPYLVRRDDDCVSSYAVRAANAMATTAAGTARPSARWSSADPGWPQRATTWCCPTTWSRGGYGPTRSPTFPAVRP